MNAPLYPLKNCNSALPLGLVLVCILQVSLYADPVPAPVSVPASPRPAPASGPDAASGTTNIIPVPPTAPAPSVVPAPSPTPTPNPHPTPLPKLVVITPVASRYDAAMAVYNQNKYADAIPLLSNFVRDFPQSNRREEIIFRLGECYRVMGRLDDALAAYTFQIQAYPDGFYRVNAELLSGEIQFDAQKFTLAIPCLQYVVSSGKGDLQLAGKYLLARAMLNVATPIPPDAELQARGLLGDLVTPPGPYTAPSALVLAELDDQENHAEVALSEWQLALATSTDPSIQAIAAARAGWSALQLKREGEAQPLFEKARTLAPTGDARKIATTGLLRLLADKKDFAGWLTVYTAPEPGVLENAREEVEFNLGQAHFAVKHWAEAVQAMDAYIHDFPNQESTPKVEYQRFVAHIHASPDSLVADAEEFVKNYPQNPYLTSVELTEAQELSNTHKFGDALPVWQKLVQASAADPQLPRLAILLEVARCFDILEQPANAATSYQTYLDAVKVTRTTNPKDETLPTSPQELTIKTRLAGCLQTSGQLLAAQNAWKVVIQEAPAGSPEKQLALESLGLIYLKGGPEREADAVADFQLLYDQFPQSKLHPLAAFTLGNALFKQQKFADSEPLLIEARKADPKSWMQPATERLVLAAFAQKNLDSTAAYLAQYQVLPLPNDPLAAASAVIPVTVPFWLAEQERTSGQWSIAEIYYRQVTQHPAPGQFLGSAWWHLGEVESKQGHWQDAVASITAFRQVSPNMKDLTSVLLALGQAQLGSKNFSEAKGMANQALLQEPEGDESAKARELLGDVAFAQENYSEAGRQFATLAVLFDNAQTAPKAMSKAVKAYDLAGNSDEASKWRAKLKAKYPDFKE